MIICECGQENADNAQFCQACERYLGWSGKKASAISVAISPDEVKAPAGGEVTSQLRVFNRGVIVDEFVLELSSELGRWASVEPASLRLFPGTDGHAEIRFRPPRSPEVQAGRTQFTVNARSTVSPKTIAGGTGFVSVEPFVEIAGTLLPQTSRGVGAAEHQLKVQNRGNTPTEVLISAADADNRLSLQLEPAAAHLEPGEEVVVKLVADLRDRDQDTQGLPQPFQVHLEAATAPPVSFRGAYTRVARVEVGAALEPLVSRSTGMGEHWVTVTNGGNAPATVAIVARDSENLLTFHAQPPTLTVEAGESARARLWVGARKPPERDVEPLPFQVSVTAPDSRPVELEGSYVPLYVALAGALQPHTSRSAGTAQHSVTVTNRGNIPAQVSVSASDPDNALAFGITPSLVTAEPGQRANVTLWVGLRPGLGRKRVEPYPFELLLSAAKAEPAKLEGAYVPLLVELAGKLEPQTSQGVGTGEHWVTVTNQGNAPAEATISASDPSEYFAFDVTPARVALEPGASASVRLWLGPRRAPSPGRQGQPRPFQVHLSASGVAPLALEGTRIQQAPPARPGPSRRSVILALRWLLALSIAVLTAFIANIVYSTGDRLDSGLGVAVKLGLGVVALGAVAFLVFVPGRRWFVAVGVLAAGALGLWLVSHPGSVPSLLSKVGVVS